MMSNILRFLIEGEDKTGVATLQKVSTASEDTGKHLGKLTSIMAGVFGGNLLTAGAEKAVDFLKESVNAAVEDQRAEAMLTQTLHNVAGATDAQTEAVKQRLLADGEHLGIMQDQMMPAYQKLLMVTHSTTAATSLLTFTENLAAAKHIQLADAAGLVAKMQMGSNRVFKEFGVTVISNASALTAVTKAQSALVFVQNEVSSGALSGKKAISALAAAHLALAKAQFNAKDAMKSVQEGMQKVAEFTKGDAQKAADTYSGRLAQMQVRFHDLQVSIGSAVLPMLTQLMGFILQKVVPAFTEMAHWVQQNVSWLGPLAAIVLSVAAAIKIAAIAQGVWNAVLALNPIMLVVAAIAALVVGLVIAYNKVAWFRDFVQAAFILIKTIVGAVVDFIKRYWIEMLGFLIGGPFGAAIAYVITHWQQIQSVFGGVVNWIKSAWNGVLSFFGGTVNAIGSVFAKIGSVISGVFSGVWSGVSSTFTSMMNWVIDKINGVIGTMDSSVSWIPGMPTIPKIPHLANGGIVPARPGGTLARIAEAGQAEAVIPLDRLGAMGAAGPSIKIDVHTLPGNETATAREIQRLLVKFFRQSGNTELAALLS